MEIIEKKNKIIIIAVLIVVLCTICVAVGLFLSKDNNNNNNNNESPSKSMANPYKIAFNYLDFTSSKLEKKVVDEFKAYLMLK